MYQLRKKAGGTMKGLPPLYLISTPQTIIGRQPGNVHLLIPSDMISRQHAVIEIGLNGKYYIRDNSSTNGTLLNDDFVEEPTQLNDGDEIIFGGDTDEMADNFCYIFEPVFAPPQLFHPAQNQFRPLSSSTEAFNTSASKKNIEKMSESRDLPTVSNNIHQFSKNAPVKASPTAPSPTPAPMDRRHSEYFPNTTPKPISPQKERRNTSFQPSQKISTSYNSEPAPKQLYDLIEIKKTGVLTEDFIKHGTEKELDSLAGSRVNFKKISNCAPSPLSIAILNDNTKMAMRLLHHLHGEADFSYSKLQSVPASVITMVKAGHITKLDLSNNQLIAIPSELASMRSIDISNNPLTAIPANHRDNWNSIRKYLTNAINTANDFSRKKILVIGGVGTGKTTVVKLLTGTKVDLTKRIEGENVTIRDITWNKTQEVSFWNLGGNVVSSSSHKFYMDTGCVYILTFNFSNLEIHDLEYWLKLIKSHVTASSKNCVVLAVGTHCEKLTDEEITNTIETLHAKFPKRVFPFLQDIISLNCKSNSGVTSLKKRIKDLVKHSSINYEISPPWIQLNMKIRSVRVAGTQYVMFDEYKKWAEGVGIFGDDAIQEASSFLSSIGSILWYKKNYDSNIVFLEPNALFNLIERIKDLGSELKSPGFIPQSSLHRAYIGFPEAIYIELSKLLLNSNIFFRLPNRDGFFVPSVLNKLAPRSEISKYFPPKLNENDSCFGRVFKFQQLPLNLLDRVLASTLNLPNVKDEALWRNGLLVRYRDNILVSIEYFQESYKMSIELRFDKTIESTEPIALAFWRQVLENVRTQLEGFCSGVSWNEFVPCIHCIRRGVFRDRVYLFDYQQVIDAIDSPFMYCNDIESSSRCIPRIEVAPDIALRDLPQVSMRRLKIGEQIGEGGFGVVYKGTLETATVAVKELSCHGSLDGDLFREFQVEAFIQGLLDHPNCVKIHGLTASPPRMVLEFISGGDLCHLIHPKKKPKPTIETLPWLKRYNIAFDIAKGIYHMQTRNPPIIHRDIRSPNIFMMKDGKALIGDFGLARQVNPEVGGMLGTWQWLAPECIDSVENAYTEKTDIYSFGMVLWEIVTCDVPFEEYQEDPRFSTNGKLKLQDLKRAIIDDGLRPTLPSYTPPDLKDLIERCWLTDVNKRPSCKELLERLGNAAGKQNEVNSELNGQNNMEVVSMDSRLSSHLVKFSCPEIESEKCLSETKLRKDDGKPRVIINVGDTVWTGTTAGYIYILKLDQNDKIQTIKRWQAHAGRIAALYSTNTHIWSCSDDDGNIHIWDIEKLCITKTIKPFGDNVNRGCGPSNLILVNDKMWVAASQQGKIAICTLKGKVKSTIRDEELLGMNGMALHKELIWIANAGKIIMFDSSKQIIGSFQAHNAGRMATHILSHGDTVWTACSSELRIWDAPCLEMMSLAKEVSIGDGKYLCIAHSKDTGRIFTGSFNGELVMWNSRDGTPMQEMVPTLYSMSDIAVSKNNVWCVTSLCEVFVFSSDLLHPKPKVAKMDMLTIRNSGGSKKPSEFGGNKPMLPSERSKLNRPGLNSSSSSDLGRKKQKGITLRKHVDDEGVSGDEVARRLANPMVTLRKVNRPTQHTDMEINSGNLPQQPNVQQESTIKNLSILASNSQLLPCKLQADANVTVANLLQKLIPQGLSQMNICQPGLPFEIMYQSGTESTPTRFTPSNLAQPVLTFGTKFILNRIPTQNLQGILQAYKIEIYCVVNNSPEPSAQIQIFAV